MNRPLTQRADPQERTVMGCVCEVLAFLAGFALLFGMAFLALAIQ